VLAQRQGLEPERRRPGLVLGAVPEPWALQQVLQGQQALGRAARPAHRRQEPQLK